MALSCGQLLEFLRSDGAFRRLMDAVARARFGHRTVSAGGLVLARTPWWRLWWPRRQHGNRVGQAELRREIDGPVWSVSGRGTGGPLDRVAQIADRKHCRPHARPFRLGFPRKVPVFPICPPAAL